MGKLLLYFYTHSVDRQMIETVWITHVVQEHKSFKNNSQNCPSKMYNENLFTTCCNKLFVL